jgi:hypothetical protein
MPEPNITLPVNHAFVLQLQRSSGTSSTEF